MAGLLETLLRPDREENPEKAEVARAANILQVGEFQFLQLAYHAWHETELPEVMIDRLFADYMIHDDVPHWARHYARRILDLDARGQLDWRDPRYHRYDPDYAAPVPRGVRRFCIASLVVFGFLGGGMLFSHYAARDATSILPPYFEENELKPAGPQPRS